jgi:hypothetical protein
MDHLERFNKIFQYLTLLGLSILNIEYLVKQIGKLLHSLQSGQCVHLMSLRIKVKFGDFFAAFQVITQREVLFAII